MIRELFFNLLEVSIVTSFIIVLVCLLSPVVDRKYVASWKYAVWFGITVRLLVPIPLTLPDAPLQFNAVHVFEPSAGWQAPLFPEAQTDVPAAADQSKFRPSWQDLTAAVWLAGATVFFIWHVLGYYAFVRSSRRWSLAVSREQQALFGQVVQELKIRRHVSLRKSASVESPMLYGIFRPTVILPIRQYSDEELTFIFKHELTHFVRRDIQVKFLLFVVRTLYWFNPLVHLMAKRFSETMELICDEYVVKGEDSRFKRKYMETILHSVEQRTHRSSPFISNYNGGLKVVKKRFRNISLSSHKKRGVAALLGFAAICAVSSSLVVFGQPSTQAEPETSSAVPSPEEPADGGKVEQAGAVTGIPSETARNQGLEDLIAEYFEIPANERETTRYYYNYADFNGDGTEEILALVVGPYSSGSGGSTALIAKEQTDGKLQLKQVLTLIQAPVILSDTVTDGYRDLIVFRGGGGAAEEYVKLTAADGKYSNVNEGIPVEPIDSITGQALLNNDLAKDMEEGTGLHLLNE